MTRTLYPPGFEWDAHKARTNLAKHGIDFVLATLIFSGPFQEQRDERDYEGEVRFQALGQANGRKLFVVFTWREDRRRLISARPAGTRR